MEQTGSKKARFALLLGGLVVLAALAIGGYFWWTKTQPAKYTGPVEKVTMGVGVAPLSLLIWVAENEGYFVDNGLDVEINDYPSGPTFPR